MHYKQGDANGYGHGLKYVFGPASYARAAAAGFDLATATGCFTGCVKSWGPG